MSAGISAIGRFSSSSFVRHVTTKNRAWLPLRRPCPRSLCDPEASDEARTTASIPRGDAEAQIGPAAAEGIRSPAAGRRPFQRIDTIARNMRAEPQLPVVRAPERPGFWTDKERLDEPPANSGACRAYEVDGRDGTVERDHGRRIRLVPDVTRDLRPAVQPVQAAAGIIWSEPIVLDDGAGVEVDGQSVVRRSPTRQGGGGHQRAFDIHVQSARGIRVDAAVEKDLKRKPRY